MQEISKITWRELFGNKFSRALHGAMLTKEGLWTTQRIQQIGHKQKQMYLVHYDKEFINEWIWRKLLSPLENMGIEAIKILLEEAWESHRSRSGSHNN